jgi:hypothetical protein
MISEKIYTFAQIRTMTYEDALAAVGMALADVTAKTYLYASFEDEVRGLFRVEAWDKSDVHSYFPDDSGEGYWGYAWCHVNQQGRTLLQEAEAARA